MPEVPQTARPSLPTSTSDFDLPSSSATAQTPSMVFAADDLSPFMLRYRKPSLLAPKPAADARSPLASSFTPPLSRRYSTSINGEDSESDRDKMSTDSPPSGSSGDVTPLTLDAERRIATLRSVKKSRPRSPSMPPSIPPSINPFLIGSKGSNEPLPSSHTHARRPSVVKFPRIQDLVAEEARPVESEVKSEAQFQRLLASCSDLPRTPRSFTDRGRYPEEADTEEHTQDDTSSDDGDEEEVMFAYAPSGSEPINIRKSITPARSISGDDMGMSESPSAAMDVDFPSPAYGSPNLSSWRYTPPPTSSAVRTNKRKFDDRYDPYPTAAKRRAVSPSLTLLRESQPSLFPRTPGGSVRMPGPMSIAIPTGPPRSGASSPVFSGSYSTSGLATPRSMMSGTTSVLSSPTLRAQMGLGSPVLRPMLRARREGEEREVAGAGEAVHGLNLG